MNFPELLQESIKKGLKVGVIDIETSPNLSYHWRFWDEQIDPKYTVVPSQITSVSIKNLNTQKTKLLQWSRPKGKFGYLKTDLDRDLLIKLRLEVDKFDVLIGQNHKSFDIRVINWRLNLLDLEPIKNLILLDTKVESKKVFYTPSNALGYKSHQYKLGGKILQTMDDCVAVAQGKVEETKNRLTYNKKDTDDTDFVFWKELKFYKIPNILVKLLKFFIQNPNRSYCVLCASQKQARFDLKKTKAKTGFDIQCNRCDSKWKIKNESN